MERRHFMLGGLTALASAAVTRAASANPSHGVAAATTNPALTAAVAASNECLQTAQICLRHCIQLLGQGDTTMNECNRTVHNMIAVCTAFTTVGSMGTASPSDLKALALSCAAFCHACAASCEQHASHHEFCKACFESCVKCEKACRAYAAAA